MNKKEHSYNMKLVYLYCQISKQAHQQAKQRSIKQADREVVFIRLMEQTRILHPGMGLRTMYEMHEPEGIGRDAFVALGLQEGFRLKALDKYVRTTYSVRCNRYQNLLVNKRFTGVNQLWSSDITYLFVLGQFYYLTLIMDVYSRRIVGYCLADNMRAENNLKALEMAFTLRGIKDYKKTLIHHSDKGSQYASEIYTTTLDSFGVSVSMCNEVYENTHIERLNDTIKNQYLNRWHIPNETILKRKVDQAVKTYNTSRPHQSIGKKSPMEYEQILETIPMENRIKMEIHTSSNQHDFVDPKQLNLMFT